jgi:hypothetical protein
MAAGPRKPDGTLDMFSLANAKTPTAMPGTLLAVRVSAKEHREFAADPGKFQMDSCAEPLRG